MLHQLVITPRFGTKSRALVVDGHATSRSILVSHLRQLGVGQVLQCGRASEARQQMQARGFDVLLCEHRLEDGVPGQALIDELRRLRLLSLRTVVIVLSSDASYDVVAEVAESALDGFLIKPYTVGALEDRLLRAFVRKESLKEILDAVEAERYADALALCNDRLTARGPHWTPAARIGAELAIRLEDLPLATAMYDAVLADKAVPWAKLGLARVLHAAGSTGEAVSTIEGLLSTEPTYVDAYDVLGRIHAEQGNLAAALQAYARAIAITPNSVARVQKHALLAYYAGDRDLALQALERATALGGKSAGFDPQMLVLLAFTRYRLGGSEGLRECRPALAELIARGQAAQAAAAGAPGDASPSVQRLARLADTARVLDAVIDGQVAAARSLLAGMAAEIMRPDFEVEAATNLLSLLSGMAAAGQMPADTPDWVRRVGLRFCAGRHATEVLARACDAHEAFAEGVRKAYAEISEVTRHALTFSLQGQHQRAVEELLNEGEKTLNAKMARDAAASLARYRDMIEPAEALAARCDALRLACGISDSTPVESLMRRQEPAAPPAAA